MAQRPRARRGIARLVRLAALVLCIGALAIAPLTVLYDVGQAHDLGRLLAGARDRLGADGPVICFILGGLGLILLAGGGQDRRSRRASLEVALGILVLLVVLRTVPPSSSAGIGALLLMLLVTLGWAVRTGLGREEPL
jgi:peptidoglycan/LPS O-acetylase OafA/YrhL